MQQIDHELANESGEQTEDLLVRDNAVGTQRVRPGNLAALSISLFALAACLYMVAPFLEDRHVGSEAHPTVRSLLDGPEFTDVATDNFMKLGGPGNRAKVHTVVSKHLKDITHKMAVANPALFMRLNEATISHKQKSAVLSVVSSMADPRVQDIGFDIHQAVEEGSSEGREGVQKHVSDAVAPRLEEMRLLRDEIIPSSLRKVEPTGDAVSFTPDRMHAVKDFTQSVFTPDRMHAVKDYTVKDSALLDRIRWMQAAQDRMHAEKEHTPARRLLVATSVPTPIPTLALPTPMPTPMPPHIGSAKFTPDAYAKIENSFGVIGGLLEQLRVVLDQVDAIDEDFGHSVGIPYWLKSLIGLVSFADEVFDCTLRAQANGTTNPVKTFMCPMKYSSAFMDGVHGLFNVMNVDNQNLEAIFTTSQPLPAGLTLPPVFDMGSVVTTETPFAWMNSNTVAPLR